MGYNYAKNAKHEQVRHIDIALSRLLDSVDSSTHRPVISAQSETSDSSNSTLADTANCP